MMIRRAACINKGSIRLISKSAIRHNVASTTAEANPQTKKKFSWFGFLFKTGLLVGTVYGGTLYVATKNDKVMDFVVDQKLPYHEELIDIIETTTWQDVTDSFDSIKNKLTGAKLQKEFEELTERIEKGSEDLINETRKRLGGAATSTKAPSTPTKGTDITPAQQLQKPVEIESVKKTRDITRLPLIELNTEIAQSVDEHVKGTVASFNKFIQGIDASAVSSSNANLIKTVNENITELALKLNALTKTFDDELQRKLKVSQTDLYSSFTKKELELTENLLEQFNKEKSQLETKLNEKLLHEIQAAREAITQAATNAVSMVRIEQTRKFEKLIVDKIDQERNGRLANLEKLNTRVEDLEKFAESVETQLQSNHKKSLIQQSISKIRSLLLAAPNSNEQPKHLQPFVEDLNSVSTDNELLNLALKDLTPLISNESSQSILTTPQLLSRWEQLAPEFRSASLLPPNAGLLGHLSSILFSKLLVPVKGVKEGGKDIESVIARVESSLARGELDVAVEEVASLKGWCRKLADDWVVEGRKRLEVEFLLNLIESESKIM